MICLLVSPAEIFSEDCAQPLLILTLQREHNVSFSTRIYSWCYQMLELVMRGGHTTLTGLMSIKYISLYISLLF